MKVLLKDIADIKAGQGAPQDNEDYSRNGIPFIKAGNLHQLLNGLDVNNLQKVSNDVASQYKLRLYPKGTILFAKSGMSCMKGYIYVLPCNAYVVNHLACIIPYGNYSDYLKYYLTYHKPSNLIKDNSYPSISLNDIGNQIIDFKTEKKQKTIVKQMKLLEQNISCLKKVSKKYDDFIKARFIEMFGEINNIKNSYTKMNMPEVCHIIDGDRGKNYPTAKEIFREGFCLFLNAKNVTSNGFNFNDCQYISREKDKALRNGKLSIGDIVLTTRGTLGNLAFYNETIPYENIRINSGMVILRINRDILNEIYFIEQFKMQLNIIKNKIANGSAQPQLPISLMNRIKITVPPLEIQNQFADFVRQVDKSRFRIEKSMIELEREVVYD